MYTLFLIVSGERTGNGINGRGGGGIFGLFTLQGAGKPGLQGLQFLRHFVGTPSLLLDLPAFFLRGVGLFFSERSEKLDDVQPLKNQQQKRDEDADDLSGGRFQKEKEGDDAGETAQVFAHHASPLCRYFRRSDLTSAEEAAMRPYPAR